MGGQLLPVLMLEAGKKVEFDTRFLQSLILRGPLVLIEQRQPLWNGLRKVLVLLNT